MKVYLVISDGGRSVAMTDGRTVKLVGCAPSGMYCGIDLYSDNALSELENFFLDLHIKGNMMDYEDVYSEEEISYINFLNMCNEFLTVRLVYDSIMGDDIDI